MRLFPHFRFYLKHISGFVIEHLFAYVPHAFLFYLKLVISSIKTFIG